LVVPSPEAESGTICYNPEFMREATAVDNFHSNFHSPLFTVIGAQDRSHAEPVAALYARLA
jgi:UDP-glucose 6-dehydrogenase